MLKPQHHNPTTQIPNEKTVRDLKALELSSTPTYSTLTTMPTYKLRTLHGNLTTTTHTAVRNIDTVAGVNHPAIDHLARIRRTLETKQPFLHSYPLDTATYARRLLLPAQSPQPLTNTNALLAALHLAVNQVLETSFINRFIWPMFSSERKFLPWYSHLVEILTRPRSFTKAKTNLLSPNLVEIPCSNAYKV